MKKILAFIILTAIISTLCISLASCGENQNSGSEKAKLVMATNAHFPPYEYYDGTEITGIDVEIAKKIAEKIGMELEIEDVKFGAIITGVQSGKYDMGMAGMTVNEERKLSVDFTDSYASAKQVVIVKEDSGITSFEEFYTGFDDEEKPIATVSGIKIGVQQDTTGDIYASDEPKNWGFGEENVIKYTDGEDAVQALITGKVNAVIIDNEPAKSFVNQNEGLKILDGAYADEDYAICIAKGNTELYEKVNNAIKELIADGTVKSIVDKYIG